MKKIIFMGRSGCGKTTLIQALGNEKIEYSKTQYVTYGSFIIDTPGEYMENKSLGSALALYAYEADIVGLLVSATEPYMLFSPNITCMANREVIGIVTKADKKNADTKRAKNWLKLAGCEKIFTTSSINGNGLEELLNYLKQNQQKPTKK